MPKRATPSGTDAVEGFLDRLAPPQLGEIRLRQRIGHVPARTF